MNTGEDIHLSAAGIPLSFVGYPHRPLHQIRSVIEARTKGMTDALQFPADRQTDRQTSVLL